MKLALPSSLENHYEMLRLLYTGCQGIVEVQGYVLIAHVSVRSVPLDNLRIIRGSQLYNSSYALAVHNNIHHSQTGLGLRELRLRSLTGKKIYFKSCLEEFIFWEILNFAFLRILTGKTLLLQLKTNCCIFKISQRTVLFVLQLVNQADAGEKQIRTAKHGPKPNDCCHVQCAAGCTGPKDTDCLACRHFNDSGTCKDNCPPPTIYDPNTFQSKPNKDKKFSFGATCVKQCPHNYLAMEVACTMVCPKANKEVITVEPDGQETQKCEKCEGECPKVCYGLGMGNLQGVSVVDASNIGMFVGCEKIYGSLAFLSDSFKVNAATNSSGLQLSDLEKLKTVEEITGYLYIDTWPDYLLDLSVFENLKVIRGRMLYKGVFSLGVQSLQIESLGLRSLRSVSGGIVLIHNNSRLCYTSSLPWNSLLHPTQGPNLISNNNQDQQTCVSEGKLCDPLCADAGCWGPGPSQCVSCVNYKRGTECVEQCNVLQGSVREFVDGLNCVPCHPEYGDVCVERCPSGVKEDQHTVWKYFNATGHCLPCETNCTVSCPLDDRGCPIQKKTGPGTTVAVTVGGVFLFIILLALLVFYLRRQKHHKKKETRRRMQQEHELVEPLTPSGAMPNQAQMQFLSSHQGVWAPDGENVKIPVAIKVLRENTSPKANKEILDEAYVMAGVASPYVCRLLGICLTSTVQLVTQLMPYGCLLDYVKENKDRIGSQYLLNWCVQIAKGMSYLEDVRLVHRDLAARNVLVKNPNHVKITDFGLARLLDIDEKEYHADGGKVPIKWMALESILHRKFTHQSDVWSYGVTVWELMTFGMKPYDLIPAREIPDLLERGERLPQPFICTADVYMIMVKCWMIDPDSRPRFKELVEEFTVMARDPPRYVVIMNDDQMSLSSPVDSEFFRTLLAEEGGNVKELLDAEEYLVPQTGGIFNTQGEMRANGPSRHHSHRSTDQGLEVDGMPSGRDLYSSVSTLGQSQYPTLPMRASANGMWTGTQYPPLVRSISHRSAGGQSDSVFVDGYVEDNGPPSSPCRYSKDPTIPNGIDGELETDGPVSFLSHTLPRGAHAQPEYVNQDVHCERPSTLPRKASERRFINGLYTGNSVENPEYLVPVHSITPISPAFDNPYYHDIAAKAQAVARASINGGTTHRQPNGYMTPTAENPEYLGLAETWSGQMEYT
ncbi:Receptor tyrosine-protein kinase erbB-2 [Labeo rohita]|uniref:Receptor protein-tyrosine kinase n=1 Tax=Labeo rohita TaxID=84645 RepID=A0ABQ8M8V1_LABRO|nr:Receptor tyrosine-protein kinase erbB-2 [Labeo rohita]